MDIAVFAQSHKDLTEQVPCLVLRLINVVMTMFKFTLGQEVFKFANLVELMAKASPLRSGDVLAGVAAKTEKQRAVAQLCLAEVPLKQFLNEALIEAGYKGIRGHLEGRTKLSGGYKWLLKKDYE